MFATFLQQCSQWWHYNVKSFDEMLRIFDKIYIILQVYDRGEDWPVRNHLNVGQQTNRAH